MSQQNDDTYRNGIMNALRDSARDGRVRDVRNILDQHGWLLNHSGALYDAMADAAYRGGRDVLQVFFDSGVGVDFSNDLGNSILHSAAAQGRVSTIDFLLDRGAEINHQDSSGNTALYFAALSGNVEAAERLVEKGADAGLRGRDNFTPVEAARHHHFDDVADRLLEFIAHRHARKAKHTFARRRRGLAP